VIFLKLYCTLTRTKRDFVPVSPGVANVYVCGPTVYNLAHIGNARPPVVFDVLRRFLEHQGYQVNYLQNFTDIDDKIINVAAQQGVSFSDISEKYIAEFLTDMSGLNIKSATRHPRVTEEIPEIIAFIEELVAKDFAYEVDGTVYFCAHKSHDYGKLSKKNIEDLEAGARVEVNAAKRHVSDFVLWKAAKPGEPHWDSPWGHGRPGWHIECSAMGRKYVGNTIDIHCGGEDLIFPHHENEIAQSEAANDAPFVNYWLHNGMILVDRQKMSKSGGNFFLVRDIAQNYPYQVIRFFILSVHYRSPLNFSDELMAAAQAGFERIKNCRRNLADAIAARIGGNFDAAQIAQFRNKFIDALNDDLNTANAITALFELVTHANKGMADGGADFARVMADEMDFMCEILGLKLDEQDADASETAEIEDLITQRNAAKAAKDFALADEIRAKLANMGVVIKDTREGTKWHYER